MTSSDRGKDGEREALSPRTARVRWEEDLGKLDISEEEATPLVIDDRDKEAAQKWMLAGKVLHRHVFHIQTITSALRPAWGNPRGLVFRSVGENMFVAEFATQRDRDRVRDGSPWLVSKNVVILSEFEDCMQPSELKFDRLQMWARVLNLPFNLGDKKWWLPIAHQIDKLTKEVYFDHVGGYLRVRVTVDVAKPLRRCILIDSARRQKVDMYDVQYEQIPHFCFSCGRLGHSDLLCPTPGTRDANGLLPFGKGLRAMDERKKYSEGSTGEPSFTQKNKADIQSSSNAKEAGLEATSPLKSNSMNKRKAGTQVKVYRKVLPLLMDSPAANNEEILHKDGAAQVDGGGDGGERDPKKKKPTTTSSDNMAAAAGQPCLGS
ncbi:hypothetical protein ACQ4PT_038703 [Festuca glaucescens]